MSNAFDSGNYPTQIPQVLVAGDRWAWKRTDLSTDYGADYTLSYELTKFGGSTPITATASLSGTEYIVEVSQATTAAYAAGDYSWAEIITRDSDSERIRLDYGTLVIKPDPAISTADPRSHSRIVLDAIRAVIEGRATLDQQSYTIAGRELVRTPIPDLLALETRYSQKVKTEDDAENIRRGLNSGSQIVVRMR